jgi:hypothetical protein
MTENLERMRRLEGDDSVNTVSSMAYLADLHGRMGRVDLALPLLRDVLQRKRRVLGNRHPSTLITMTLMSQSLCLGGDTAAGIELLEEAVAGYTAVHGADHPRTRRIRETLEFRKDREGGHPEPDTRPPESTVPGWKLEWSSKWGRWYWWHTGTRETSWTEPTAGFSEGELTSCDACGQRLKAPVRCNVLVCPNCKHHVRATNRPDAAQQAAAAAQQQAALQQQQQQQAAQQQQVQQQQVQQQVRPGLPSIASG